MSNVVTGSIEGQGKNFTGRFNVNGRSKKLTGSFYQGVVHYKSTAATLAYGDFGDVSGPYMITVSKGKDASFVGQEALSFNLINEDNIALTISGKLVAPIDERQTVTGECEWTDDNE